MTTTDEVVLAFELLAARHSKPKDDTKQQYPYRLVPFDELQPGTKSPYLVDGVIPLQGLVAVWGPPKCGKSFWTFDLSMHVALRRPYRGRRVNGGPVCYLAFEGAAGFGARAEAFRRTHEITGKVPFFLLASNAKLVRDHKALIASIDGQMDAPPMLVVLDTLNRSIDGSESKDQDMGAYLAAAEMIVQAFDCVVIIVHHSGVVDSRPRGHTSLTGAVDAQLAVKRDTTGTIMVEVEAMKDGAEGTRFASTLRVVEVGTDDDGKPITSCVIEPSEVRPAAGKRPKLSPAAKLALEQLRELIAEAGEPAPPSTRIPADALVCSAVLWRENFYRGHIGDKGDTKKKAFNRAVEKLQEAHLIGVWSDKVWLPGQRTKPGQFEKCPAGRSLDGIGGTKGT